MNLFNRIETDNIKELRYVYLLQNLFIKVNLQNCDEGLGSINYDLGDLSCWEHLLAGEPFHRRQLVGVDLSEKKTALDTEKHLDVPASWVEKLDITADGKPGTLRYVIYFRT